MSLSLSNLIALEEAVERDLLGEISDSQDVEELMVRADMQRQENERMVDDYMRVYASVRELESQNEAIEGIVRTEGSLAPSAAAGFEAARRAAVLSAGIDPDSRMAQPAIDQTGLESMMNGTYVLSLEENKSFIQKLKDLLNLIISKLSEGWKKFKLWFQKITNILPKKIRPLYNELKGISDEAFNTAISNFSQSLDEKNAGEYSGAFTRDKKLIDPQNLFKDLENFIKKSNPIKIEWQKFINEAKAVKGGSDSESFASAVTELREKIKALAEKLDGTKIDVGGRECVWINEDGVPAIDDEWYTGSESEAIVIEGVKNVTKSKLLNALNTGLGLSKMYDKLDDQITPYIKLLDQCNDILKDMDDSAPQVAKELLNLCKRLQANNIRLCIAGKCISKNIIGYVASFAEEIIAEAKKQTKSEA